MVKSYEDFFDNSGNNNSNNFRSNNADAKKEEDRAYLDIWEEIPSYKDVNQRESILKSVSFVVIGLFFLFVHYSLLLTSNYR